jgi:predicted membrane protein
MLWVVIDNVQQVREVLQCLLLKRVRSPLCAFGIAFANGAIYAQSARYIDKNVPIAYNLVSLSVWLFVGDIGSVIGSNVLLRLLVGVEQLPWFVTTTTIASTTATTSAIMTTMRY